MTHIQMSEAQLVMLWYSHINPKRPEPQSRTLPGTKSLPRTLHVQDLVRKHEACPPGWYYQTIPDALTLPNWVVHALHVAETEVHSLFSAAIILFMLWVDAHEDEALLAQNLRRKVPKWNSYSCRIIQDTDGKFSFIPYWTADRLRLKCDGTDDRLLHISPLHGRAPSGMCVFGDPGTDDYSIVTSCYRDEEDAAMPRSQFIRTGFEDFKKYRWLDLEALRREMI